MKSAGKVTSVDLDPSHGREHVGLPTLEILTADPDRASELPRDMALALLAKATTVQGILLARLLIDGAGTEGSSSASEPEEWLPAEEVTRRFGLSTRWLTDHRRELRQLRIVSQPSRKTILYHARRLARFLEARSGP